MAVTDPDFHQPSYETGYGEGESSMLADYVIALDDVWPEERGEPYPSVVAAYVAELKAKVERLRVEVDEALSERDEAELSAMRAKTETAEWVSAYDAELVRRKTAEATVARVEAIVPIVRTDEAPPRTELLLRSSVLAALEPPT